MEQFTLRAPAKLNLFLGVSPEISLGKHLLTSVFTTISLSDSLTFTHDITKDRNITVEVINSPGIAPLDVPLEHNMVYKAVIALEKALNRKLEGHLNIRIEKSIPHAAGLAGGSSDAATTMLALLRLWGMEDTSSATQIHAAAQSLGADVSFFLSGGCALMGGSGEQLLQTLPQPALDIVLVKPGAGISTAEAYAAFDADPQPIPSSDLLISMLRDRTTPAQSIAGQFANNLSRAACALLPELEPLIEDLAACKGVYKAMVAGSGSTVFGVCENSTKAEGVAEHFRERGYWSVVATTL